MVNPIFQSVFALQESHRISPPHWPSSKNAVRTKRFRGQGFTTVPPHSNHVPMKSPQWHDSYVAHENIPRRTYETLCVAACCITFHVPHTKHVTALTCAGFCSKSTGVSCKEALCLAKRRLALLRKCRVLLRKYRALFQIERCLWKRSPISCGKVRGFLAEI